LTDEGYDPIYGARPLRRAIMKYLEDTLAEQCLSKTLYPNTKIIVTRKKVEGTLLTYTNELQVTIDFSDVDPNLLDDFSKDELVSTISSSSVTNDNSNGLNNESKTDSEIPENSSKSNETGKTSRFFRKKNN
jgi:hypothetical protein